MYTDINNPFIRDAQEEELEEENDVEDQKEPRATSCQLYLYNDWNSDNDAPLKVFTAGSRQVQYPFWTTEQQTREDRNALWRHQNQMTNSKYLKRRKVTFFTGTLAHFDEFQGGKSASKDPLADMQSEEEAFLLPPLKRRKTEEQLVSISQIKVKFY